MKSIWQEKAKKPNFERLDGDIKTDVLIIGGGAAGILCGYMLKNSGVDAVIVDAKEICGGTTGNTTAKITLHHGAIFDKMIKRYGTERAELYIKAHGEALEKYRELSRMFECDFEAADSFVYSVYDRAKVEKEVIALNNLKCEAEFMEKTELPFRIAGAVKIANQAKFNPLKLFYAMASGLKILENTMVLKIEGNCAVTNRGKIRAEKIIVTTHFPLLNNHGFYFLKMYQHRSYVLALENAQKMQGMYVDEDEKGMSFRSYKEFLLLGGGGHRTGKQGGGWRELPKFANRYYPNANEAYRFAAQDCKTLDDIAYIGQYSFTTPRLYAATGFNKWGMTCSMLSAEILTDLALGRENEYSAVFSPSRSILHKQLFINAGESVLGLLTPTAPRCTHLGCALKYNRQEHSWDCGCHGSRFSQDGHLINNPAKKDIRIKGRVEK